MNYKRVENKLKCFVPFVTCLFVILVIHLTLQLFSLNITNDHLNNTPLTPQTLLTPLTSTFYQGVMVMRVVGCGIGEIEKERMFKTSI